MGFPSLYETFRLGALLRASYVLSPQLVASGRLGYVDGFPQTKSNTVPVTSSTGAFSTSIVETSTSWSYVPVLVGGRYYFSPSRAGFHVDAELGIYASWFHVYGSGYDYTTTDTRPALNLGAGYIIPGEVPLDVMIEWSGYAGLGASVGVKLK